MTKYVCIFHHDDVMLPENLERKVRILEEHPEVGFVHSNLILIDPEGRVIARQIWNEDSRRDYFKNGLEVFHRFLDYLPSGSSIFIGAVLARRECYERLGGFNPELLHCNDSEMWIMNICPKLFKNATFWKTVARLSAGPIGNRLYKAVKHLTGNKHVIL